MKYLTLFLILINLNTLAESFVYITDQVDIPVRTDKTFGDNIIRSVSSGTKMSVLEATEDGWTKVKFDNITGWIISRYLSNDKPARTELKKLRQTYNANKILIGKQNLKNKKLEKEIKNLKIKNTNLAMQTGKSNAEKEHIEQVYKDALKLEHTNEKLTSQVLQLKNEVQLLKSSNVSNQDVSSRNWFIVGSIVLFFGIIIGFILPKFVTPRRY